MAKTVKKPNLLDIIRTNLNESRTYDAPVLRFNNEPIKIFLWDDNQEFSAMKANLDLTNQQCIDGYRGLHHAACTAHEYLPWYNIKGDHTNPYPAACLEDPFDLEYVDLPDYFISDLKPVKGRVCEVSLEVLHLLDEYYDNGYSWERSLIDVKVRSLDPNSPTTQAYTWFNEMDELFDFVSHDMAYKIKPHLDFSPMYSDEKFYSYGGYNG